MKWILCLLIGATLTAQETSPTEKSASATSLPDTEKSVLFIEPKARANDYLQAFELLRKDKPTFKIVLRTKSNPSLPITELNASSSGTLLFAKVPSNTGGKYLIVPIEEILEIAYSTN